MRKLSNEELGRIDVATYKAQPKNPVVVVLDNIRSMHNVGSAFRTADGLCIEKIFLCGITARPPHREINKTALGATSSVTWEYTKTTMEAIQKLRNEGFRIISIEQADQSKSLESYTPDAGVKYAIVFGNEVFGIDETIVRDSDEVIEIPQYGTKHSFNIAVSIGIVLWDFLVKLKKV